MKKSLGRQAAHGAVWSVGGQGIQVLSNTIGMAIIARLINPDDFGVVAMVTALVGLGELFRDFGLTNATIQAPTISKSESMNLFWLNTLMGLLLGGVFYALSTPIAMFYDEPRLTSITQVLSVVFLFNGIATQPRAILTRNLKLKQVAFTEVISMISGVIVGIVMAIAGFGYWSLVGMQVARTVSIATLALIYARFIPKRPDFNVSVTRFIRFGVGLFGAQALGYLSKSIDNVMIGRTLGAASLGIYSRAYQLGYLPASQLASPMSRVALPVLSRVQSDPVKYSTYLYRIQKVMMLCISSGYAIAIVYADLVIRVGLGPGWDKAILVFQVICIAGMIESAHNLTYWIFVSSAQTGQHFLFSIIARPILILFIFLAVSHGIVAVAAVISLWMVFAWPLGLYIATRNIELSWTAIMLTGIRILAFSSAIIAAGLSARHLTQTYSSVVEWVSGLGSMAFVGALLIILFPSLRKDVADALQITKLLKPDRSSIGN